MSTQKRPILFIVLILAFATSAFNRARGQGCVAARGCGITPGAQGAHLGEILPPTSGFQVGVGYRWLRSDRHFSGDHENVERQEEGTEVINNSNFIDVNISYAITPRFSTALIIPFSIHDRSSTVRSNDIPIVRYHTQASGLGDIRLMAYGWVLDPTKRQKGNVLLGLGVDMPTGEKDAEDTFIRLNNDDVLEPQIRTVDQSIQPGDGGWGIVLDLYGYIDLAPRLSAFLNGFYTATPEEKNGVPTFRRNPFEAEMSIADSYMGRLGLQYLTWPKYGLSFSLAGRIEGVLAEDIIGGSDGFRRPGYAVSVEPGVSAMFGTWTMGVYTPVAVYRNRVRSVADFQQSAATGEHEHGDAAFADFSVIFSLSKNF